MVRTRIRELDRLIDVVLSDMMTAAAGAAEDLFLLGWICKDTRQFRLGELAYIRALCSVLSVPYTLPDPSSAAPIVTESTEAYIQARDALLERLLNTQSSVAATERSLPLLFVELARVYLHSGDFKFVLRLQYRAYKVFCRHFNASQ